MCYAPSLVEGSPGPTGGHIHCDKDSKFSVEVPKFCCRHPRIDTEVVGHEKTLAESEACGDVLAEFDPSSQQIRFVRGPKSTGTFANLASLQDGGYGAHSPSPVAMKAVREGKEWQRVNKVMCQGRQGTLIKFLNDPKGKAEFCPTGTPPVRGTNYASWFCDGVNAHEDRLHCCTVHGRLRCVNHLVDETNVSACNCRGVGGLDAMPESSAPLPEQSSVLWPIVALLWPPSPAVLRSVPRRDRPRPLQRSETCCSHCARQRQPSTRPRGGARCPLCFFSQEFL